MPGLSAGLVDGICAGKRERQESELSVAELPLDLDRWLTGVWLVLVAGLSLLHDDRAGDGRAGESFPPLAADEKSSFKKHVHCR